MRSPRKGRRLRLVLAMLLTCSTMTSADVVRLGYAHGEAEAVIRLLVDRAVIAPVGVRIRPGVRGATLYAVDHRQLALARAWWCS